MTGERRAIEWFVSFPGDLWVGGDQGAEVRAAFVREVLSLRTGARVLDAPCGDGRIAVHIARAGYRITGIDLTANLVRRARNRFRKEGLRGTFLVRDLRELDFDGEFDAVFNWGGSFGYFDEAANRDVVRCYARALKPGGRLLIDQPTREYLLRHFHPSRKHGRMSIRARWDATTERLETTYRFTHGGGCRRFPMSIRLYTPGQFRRLLAGAGLVTEAVYGSLDGSRYHRGWRRIYVVGRKK